MDQNYAKMLLTLHKNSKHNRAGRMLIIVFGELKQLRIQMSNGNNFEFWRTGNTIGYYSFNNFQVSSDLDQDAHRCYGGAGPHGGVEPLGQVWNCFNMVTTFDVHIIYELVCMKQRFTLQYSQFATISQLSNSYRE